MKRTWVVFAALALVQPVFPQDTEKRDGAYYVVSHKDEFEGWTADALMENKLGGSSPSEKVELTIMRTRATDKTPFKYSLNVHYLGDDWVFIEEGKSLLLLLDGKKMTFTGAGSKRSRRVGSGYVSESSIYGAEYDSLLLISSAKEVKVRVVGGEKNLDRFFSQQNFQILKRFLTEYPPVTKTEGKDSLKTGDKPDTAALRFKKP